MALFTYAFAVAQLETFVLDDFENGQVNFTEIVNVNPPAHFDVAVVDNPVKAGINTSNKVWEWKRYDASPDNRIWAGFYSTLKTEIPTGYHRIEIKYLRKNATSQLKIKPEGAIAKEILPVTPASKTNEWETLVFDIYANGIKNIRVFGFFPDYYEPIDANSIVYVDDIKIVYDPSIVPPPPPTSLTLFSNSVDNRFHDNSWVNQTAPSTVATQHWQGPEVPNGDKLPVVTTPVKDGANAIKLQYKSATGGAWMALVAATGWTAFDLTQMTHLKFWVNSPVALSKDALPKIFFESHSGSPNKTGKLPMSNYVDNLVADTWTEVVVPLADIWAADVAFTAKDVVKGVFFEQNNATDVEYTLYLDEFKFELVVPALVLFDNSADNRFHDNSWVNQTAPSTVATQHWQGPEVPNGDKLPVVTTPVKDGANALKLQWKSAEGGSWMALVASIGWTSFDLEPMTHLNFWVNSPVALSKDLLPKLYLESHSGNPNKTGKVNMANYVISLAANTWTEVRIPLADLYAADPAFTAKNVVKGLFFEQNVLDNAEHTIYMDEFKFIAKAPSAANSDMFVDFGSNSAAFMTEGNWNNVTDHQAANISLIDANGNATGAKLAVTDPFYNGFNTNGTPTPTGSAAVFVSNAAADNFFGNGAVWGAVAANPEGVITLSGLNPAKYYSFTVFASRMSVTNVREAKYTATGSNGDKSATLNASNNTSEVALLKDVMPTAAGVITFKTEAGPANDSAEKFYFLGAMKIAQSDNPTSVETIVSGGKLIPVYSDNVLRVGDYTGTVRIYSVTGSLLLQGQSVFGYMPVRLEKGVYIISTSVGNAKLVAR